MPLCASLLLCDVPGDGLPQPLFKLHLGLEAKGPFCQTRLQAPAWLTVRSGCIPHNPPLKASQAGDHFHHGLDTHFLATPQIHWLTLVIVLCREEDTLGSVLHVEKFPRG